MVEMKLGLRFDFFDVLLNLVSGVWMAWMRLKLEFEQNLNDRVQKK